MTLSTPVKTSKTLLTTSNHRQQYTTKNVNPRLVEPLRSKGQVTHKQSMSQLNPSHYLLLNGAAHICAFPPQTRHLSAGVFRNPPLCIQADTGPMPGSANVAHRALAGLKLRAATDKDTRFSGVLLKRFQNAPSAAGSQPAERVIQTRRGTQ